VRKGTASYRGIPMKAKWETRADLTKRTSFTRITGVLDEADVRAWAKQYRERCTAPHRGRRHMVIADMRGMRALSVKVAEIMGQEIGHARRNGVVLCAHISDDTVQRLQAGRVARQNSVQDDVTVDCATLTEAERVCDDVRAQLDDASIVHTARAFAKAS
jgi:hypothetical protein